MYGDKVMKKQRGTYHHMVEVAEDMVPRGHGPLSPKRAMHESREEVTEILGYEHHHKGLPKRLLNRYKNY